MQLHCLLKWHSYYYVLVIFTRNFFNFHTGDRKKMNTIKNCALKNPFNPLCS